MTMRTATLLPLVQKPAESTTLPVDAGVFCAAAVLLLCGAGARADDTSPP